MASKKFEQALAKRDAATAPVGSIPTTAVEVRQLMAQELIKPVPDRFRLQGLSRLLDSFELQEKAAEASATTVLPTITAERDALAAKVAELAPLAGQLPTLAQDLAALKASFDSKVAEMREELTAKSTEQLANAEKAERETNHKLALAENYSQAALQETFDIIRPLVENQPMPSFWDASPTIAPIFWTLWGWSSAKARMYTSVKKSFPTCDASFRNYAYQTLLLTIPQFEGVPNPEVRIENFAERVECVKELAARWKVLDDIVCKVDAVYAERAGRAHLAHVANIHEQESMLARQGFGRTPLGTAQESSSITNYDGSHLEGCVCSRCGNGLPAHLRSDVYLGTQQEAPEPDVNEPSRPLHYGEDD